VAHLVASGYTNRMAAHALHVSTNTVSTHLRSVYAKLCVRSRVELTNALRDEEAIFGTARAGWPSRPTARHHPSSAHHLIQVGLQLLGGVGLAGSNCNRAAW
jgi:hypothetical protein